MGTRTSMSLITLALLAIVLAYTVSHKTDGTTSTAIAYGQTTVECKNLTPVAKELQSESFTVDNYGKRVTITGLVFTTCVDPALYITPQTLDMIYENVKEQLYRMNDREAFTSATEVKTAAALEAYQIIQVFPGYQGRLVVYVESSPGTQVQFAVLPSPTP